MIVYHGSSRCFQKLRMHRSLVRSEGTQGNEGLGIYFSLHKSVAESYGRYLYTLELNDIYVRDFRRKDICVRFVKSLVKYVEQQAKIRITTHFNPITLSEYLYEGVVAISGVSEEISLLLDSDEKWHTLPEGLRNQVLKLVDKYVKDSLYAYLFNYNIRDIGVIKKVEPSVVRIHKRERL